MRFEFISTDFSEIILKAKFEKNLIYNKKWNALLFKTTLRFLKVYCMEGCIKFVHAKKI